MKRMFWMTLLALGMFSGCLSEDPGLGYTAQSQFPRGIDSVAVPMWTRAPEIYRRDLEIRLTEALDKRIESDTPYKLVPESRADTKLTGSIDMITQSTLSMNPDTSRPREIQITFYVSYTWEDLRNGDVLVEKSGFPVTAVYLPDEPFNEDFFRGSEDLMDDLARRIVETMEEPW